MSNKDTQYGNYLNNPLTDVIPKNRDELVSVSDDILLYIVQKAKGHTKTKEDFQNHMGVNYRYDSVTYELKNRGYVSGWYKPSNSSQSKTQGIPPTTIIMKPNENKPIRRNYAIDPEIAKEWDAFNTGIPYKTVTIGSAFQLFMEAFRSGKIEFKLEIH